MPRQFCQRRAVAKVTVRFAVLLSAFSALLVAQAPQPQPESFLRRGVGVTSYELGNLEKGEIVVKLPRTPEVREVAVFAIMRMDVPADFFIDKVRDIVTFKKSENVLQIGKFSDPPKLEDLAGLTLDPVDIEGIKRCRVNRCEVKMSAAMIERFRKEIDWASPRYREKVTELAHRMLLERVQTYLREGNASLQQYNDKSYPLRLGEEFQSLLQPAPYMYDYTPEFQKYLVDFPRSRPENVEDFIYWSKEKFGLKPVVSITHITIHKRMTSRGTDVLIASKGIYATHYFEASVGLTGFIQSESPESSHSYLMYVNRSRTDALRGLFAGLKRSLITGSLRDGARKNMELIRKKLESQYAAHHVNRSN